MTKPSPLKWFKTSPEIIRLAVMMYVRFPLSLRNVEDLLHERGVEISHETVVRGTLLAAGQGAE
jgi:putative transposase